MKELVHYKNSYELRLALKIKYILFEGLILLSLLMINVYNFELLRLNTVKDFISHLVLLAVVLLSISIMTLIGSTFTLKDKCMPKFKEGDIIDIDSNKYRIAEVGHQMYLVQNDAGLYREIYFNEKKITIFKSLT